MANDDKGPVHLPVLFHFDSEEPARDEYELLARKILGFLNRFEKDTVGYQEQSEVNGLRVELLAELLREKSPQ